MNAIKNLFRALRTCRRSAGATDGRETKIPVAFGTSIVGEYRHTETIERRSDGSIQETRTMELVQRICRLCGATNDPNEKRCYNCGRKL